MRDLPRQWRFVGKLMMYRGLMSRPLSKMNICPGTTSPAWQADS